MSFGLSIVAFLILVSLPILAVAAHVRHKKGSGEQVVLIGKHGSVEAPLMPEGAVLVEGEVWRARAREGAHLACGQKVRVCGAQGVLLVVEPFGESDAEEAKDGD